MAVPYTGTDTAMGAPMTIFVASAIPPRSAAMLITFATISSAHATSSAQRGYLRRMTPARPRPVTMPRRAHINCTDAINGNENSAVHNGA